MKVKRPLKRPGKPGKGRTLTLEKLEEWLADHEPPLAGVSMIDGYLAAIIVSPEFVPPDRWLNPIVGREVAEAPEGTMKAAVRNTIFQRHNQISSSLSGGPKRYAPIFMRTDDGEVLLTSFAEGFFLGMRLTIDDWKPFIADPLIGLPLMAILGHCTSMMSDDERAALISAQAAQILSDSWRVVPELIEMLHIVLAGARNIEIR